MNTKVLVGGALRAAIAFSAIAASAGAQVHYRLTDLGFAEAAAINSSAEVIGGGYIYSNGTVQYVPGGGDAVAVNDSGEIAGDRNVSGGASHAFLYSNGAMQDLGTLGGASSGAYGINNSGQVVGEAGTAPGSNASDAFLYSNGTMTALDNSGHSSANAINNEGQVVVNVGDSVFLYSNGTKTNITGTAAEGSGNSINDAGQVVGYTFGTLRAFLWSSAAGMSDLGTLAAPYNSGSEALGINLSGQIVGTSWDYPLPGDYQYHAFLYSNGTMEDLNNLVNAPGWTLEEATAINNSGQIVGWANMGALLLTPLEPGDANGDGRVDINDLTIVLSNFGQTGMAWSQGCMDGDPSGTVDMNDLTIVLSNYGYGVTAAAGVKAVPEPASLVLLLAALACLLATMRRPAHGKPRRLARKL